MNRTTGLRLLALGLLTALIAACTGSAPAPVLHVGATGDGQSQVLAHLYAAALRGAGTPAEATVTADPIAGLDTGAVAVAPGLTGRLLRTFQPDATTRSEKGVYRAMVAALPEGLAAGDYAIAAQDKPALAVTEQTARDWGGTDLRVLPRHCRALSVGAVTGADVPTKVGSCRLKTREFPTTTALFDALEQGRITAGWTSSADPDIPDTAALLIDSSPALVQAENVVPLYRRAELTERQVLALNEVAGVLDTAGLTAMRRRVDGGADPRVVVEAWLAEHPLGR